MKIKKLIEILHKYTSETQIIVYAYEFWIKKSGNLFLMAWKRNGNGNRAYQQVNKIIEV